MAAVDRSRVQQNVFLELMENVHTVAHFTVSLQTERKYDKSAASVGRSKAKSLSASGGFAPDPPPGNLPQTPVIGSRSALTMSFAYPTLTPTFRYPPQPLKSLGLG